MKPLVGCLGCAVLLWATASTARAGDYHLNYSAYPYAYGYHTVVPKSIPYFAQNPPVYYSDVVIPRPYGWSPYPFPPAYTMPQMTPAPKAPTEVAPEPEPARYEARFEQRKLRYTIVR